MAWRTRSNRLGGVDAGAERIAAVLADIQDTVDLNRMRTRFLAFLATFQTILLLSHAFVCETWIAFERDSPQASIPHLRLLFLALSVWFVAASLLAWRFHQWPARVFYKGAAVWLAFFNFLFLSACVCWIVYGAARLFRWPLPRPAIAWVAFAVAAAMAVYGLANAAMVRVRRVTVKLPNLPASWRGRTAALVSDTHLGHVRGPRFARSIVARVSRLKPDLVLIAGDYYDGTAADVRKLAEPLAALAPRFGSYFIAGNHEQFGDDSKYLESIGDFGVRVLRCEKVLLDGLQLVGVDFRNGVRADRLRTALQDVRIDRHSASILLTHAPDQPAVAEEAGIGLQVNGHTHGGQFLPWTLFARRIYGRFVYGLQRRGSMQVYTSYGAGTWGPPLRVGTSPEIVLLTFE